MHCENAENFIEKHMTQHTRKWGSGRQIHLLYTIWFVELDLSSCSWRNEIPFDEGAIFVEFTVLNHQDLSAFRNFFVGICHVHSTIS